MATRRLLQQFILYSPFASRSRSLRAFLLSFLIVFALVIPGGWTSAGWEQPAHAQDVWLESAILRPIKVNNQRGILFWLHTDPAFQHKLRPVIEIPDLLPGEVHEHFVAIQGHGEVFEGEHYLLVEGVRQWVRTAEFVAAVRDWVGYDAQILLIACNPEGARIDIPNTIYWKDNVVDVTYGIGPWTLGKYVEGEGARGRQAPILTDRQGPVAEVATLAPLDEAIDHLNAAIGRQTLTYPRVE